MIIGLNFKVCVDSLGMKCIECHRQSIDTDLRQRTWKHKPTILKPMLHVYFII